MFPALRQQIASRFLPQTLQRIQLLVEPLDSQANSGFYDLGQPFRTTARSIHRWPGTRNGPAAVHGLDSTHHPRQIFRDRQIAARELLQGAYPVLSVVDRGEMVAAQELGQLPSIDPVTLAAIL